MAEKNAVVPEIPHPLWPGEWVSIPDGVSTDGEFEDFFEDLYSCAQYAPPPADLYAPDDCADYAAVPDPRFAGRRQLIPDDLADMAPGPGLAAVLAMIEVSRLSGPDCVEVMQAWHRQCAHDQARLWDAMCETGLCAPAPDDVVRREDKPGRYAADEVRAALAFTRHAAASELNTSWDLRTRLRIVHKAMLDGRVDARKALVFVRWTAALSDEQAGTVCERLAGEARDLTTSELAARIKKLAIALDPDWVEKTYRRAVRDRNVAGFQNDDGTATVTGSCLPLDEAAAAVAHIDTLARAAKAAGDHRPIGQIRADLFLTLLQGHTPDDSADPSSPANDQPDTGQPAGDSDSSDADDGRDVRAGSYDRRGAPNGTGQRGQANPEPRERGEERRDSAGRPRGQPPPTSGQDGTGTGDRVAGGFELRVKLTTVLGMDDHPAEIAGWGHLSANQARKAVTGHAGAEWRYVITDHDGRLLHEGLIRRRPQGWSRGHARPGERGILELQIPLATLHELAVRPCQSGPWQRVISEVARRARQHRNRPGGGDNPLQRFARAGLRRRVGVRARQCVFPGCRVPAAQSHTDHRRQYSWGGPTLEENLDPLCPHDHGLKDLAGWRLQLISSDQLIWTSLLGRSYRVQRPLIIEPLPVPQPRPSVTLIEAPEDEDQPIWPSDTASGHHGAAASQSTPPTSEADPVTAPSDILDECPF